MRIMSALNRDGISYFTVYNPTSLTSLGFHVAPSWERHDWIPTPFGTTYQFYSCSEPGH